MTSGGRSRVPWWAWPSVLALDAPAVAVAWSWQIARVAGASFGVADAALVALATAAVYLLDRVRDAGRLSGDRPASLRHAWVARHTRASRVAAAVTGTAAVLLVLRLPPTGVAWAAGVAAAAGAVLVLPRGASPAMPIGLLGRPAAVGAVFAAGAALPAVAGGADPRALAPALVPLAAVAALNVAMIGAWEAQLDDGAAAPRAVGPADRRWRLGLAVGVAVALVATLAASGALRGVPIVGRAETPAADAGRSSAAPLALGALLLASLEACGSRLPSEARHLAADAALAIAPLAAPLASWMLAMWGLAEV